MTIRLTAEQWADAQSEHDSLPIVSDPLRTERFVLVKDDVYEQYRALFEDVPVGEPERLYQLQQFGRRAGWDDPALDVYGELDPRQTA